MIRDFLRQQMYPLDQFIVKKVFLKKEEALNKTINIFVLQILQLLFQAKGSFLDFIFDYFHWVKMTFVGQTHFIGQQFISEMIFCLFYFNKIPLTREYIDINLGTLLGLESHEARDLYEYYKFIDPIKKEKRPQNRRKKLLHWIRFKEQIRDNENFFSGKLL